MITLGGINLPGLMVSEPYAHTGVQATVEYAKAGNPIIHEGYIGGKVIILYGTDTLGYQTKTTMDAIAAMASVPNARYTLSLHGTEYTVRFANESPPSVSAQPLRENKDVPDGDDEYINVQIKLMVL
jgi:hypothetical protein